PKDKIKPAPLKNEPEVRKEKAEPAPLKKEEPKPEMKEDIDDDFDDQMSYFHCVFVDEESGQYPLFPFTPMQNPFVWTGP
ncbi:hypothetical protein SKAU_G00208830, partial [Synaphobranchus kaupii]